MAELDVSELMDDPDFISPFRVMRAGQFVDEHGRAHAQEGSVKPIYGVVMPASGRSLQMLPDGVQVQGAISIHTKFRLEGPSSRPTQPDTVYWQGNTYVVSNVSSYSHFGRGFIQAVCTLKDLLAPPPSRNVTDRGP